MSMLIRIQVTIGNLLNIGAASGPDRSDPVSSWLILLTELVAFYEQALPELPIDMAQWEEAVRIVPMETTVLEFLRRAQQDHPNLEETHHDCPCVVC
jgi:hypothetical protein